MRCFEKDLRNNAKKNKIKLNVINLSSTFTEHEKQFEFAYKDLLEDAICRFGDIDMDSISDAFLSFKEV